MTLRLEVSDCEVRTARGRVILSVPECRLEPGQSLGIEGPSGAGKSTFLYALAGLLDSAEGRLLWGPTDILKLSAARRAEFRAAHIGMIFQNFLLFEELGALANASLAAMYLPRADRAGLRKRAAQLLTHLGLPPGPRPVASYSGGERQRVAVARALANDADILLADEPTASLQREAADALIDDLMDRISQNGTTLVAVSHDPHLLGRMDRVLSLADGKVTTERPGR